MHLVRFDKYEIARGDRVRAFVRSRHPRLDELGVESVCGDLRHAEQVAEASRRLAGKGLPPGILVDCSHDNSCKNPDLQPGVAEDVTRQLLAGNQSIIGLMI